MPEPPHAKHRLAIAGHNVLEFFRLGRFSDAVRVAEDLNLESPRQARPASELQAIFADALQRTGQNQRAQLIVDRYLSSTPDNPSLCARYHLVLGNICREHGDSARTVEHFQIATSLAGPDLELACWSQLRLLAAIADLSGNQAALTRLDHVRRTLTRFGDSGPFAALHLWLAETDTSKGNIEQARKHLDTAKSLLATVNNVWLQAYLAINQSAVHFFAADISEAHQCAQEAIRCADESGHLASRRAAYSNFGYIQFSIGHFSEAQAAFEHALTCCEPGTPNQVVILDNIADVALHRGDIHGCRAVLSKLDRMTTSARAANARNVDTWVQHTKIRLLVKEGHVKDARALCNTMLERVGSLPNSRLWAESHLVAAETLLANGDLVAAADSLSSVLSPEVTLSPDLYAEAERVRGAALTALGASEHARLHYQYSAFAFEAIGHVVGQQRTRAHLEGLPKPTLASEFLTPIALDHIRLLVDMRIRPESFANEAYSLLEELCCSDNFMLCDSDGRTLRSRGNCLGLADRPDAKAIILDPASSRRLTLTFVSKPDAYSKLVSASFHRFLSRITNAKVGDPAFAEQTVTWTNLEGTVTGRQVIFASDQMLGVFKTIKQIANTDVSILVTGETGTGKEIVAKTIHEFSQRSGLPFLPFNCAAVPRELLESQLFGYKKGSFSGATDNFQGIVRAANGGTLLLDEFGEIPFDLQAKLLRFLEEREVHPIGETRPTKVDVRLIFSTNMNLEEAVKQRRLREDLFYRISIIPIHIPPLRERKEEIPMLAKLFAQRFAQELAKDPIRFSDSAVELLILFSWPGNVRQLANEVRRLSVLMDSGSVITPEQLSTYLQVRNANPTSGHVSIREVGVPLNQTLAAAIELVETEMIKEAMSRSGGNVSTAAASLGISRKGLYLKRLRLSSLGCGLNRTRS